MRILITNDDGIHSPGLLALVRRFCGENEVYVLAPDRQRSAFSHSVTYFKQDLSLKETEVEGAVKAWSADGTPADCVYAAVCGMMEEPPDVVISGINAGANVSNDCLYSGTVGAASEGMMLGVPSAAVSLASFDSQEFDAAAEITARILPVFLADPHRHEYVLNINVPPGPLEEIKGIRSAAFDGRHLYARKLEMRREDGVIKLHCPLIRIPIDENGKREDGDITLLENGFAAVTPITADWVDHRRREALEKMLEKL